MSGRPKMRVALITTVLNEEGSLPSLLESIASQSRQPDELIVVDGGSTDRSVSILNEWQDRLPVQVLVQPGANISQGRNAAIERTSCDIVAVTDAGVHLDPDWLERLTEPFIQNAVSVDVVSGFFRPYCETDFETALAATTLPDVEEIDGRTFLPSSRSVAFRKSWFDAGLRYTEWLDFCEDLVFDLRMKRAGARFLFRPDAQVGFRPRSSAMSFWRQYYRYARGDGKAGLFAKRHLIRYATYFFALPSLFLTRSPVWRMLVLLGAVAYVRRPAQRLWSRRNGDAIAVARLLPLAGLLRAFGDFAKMAGYPAGLLWRARNHGLRRDWRSIPERADLSRN